MPPWLRVHLVQIKESCGSLHVFYSKQNVLNLKNIPAEHDQLAVSSIVEIFELLC